MACGLEYLHSLEHPIAHGGIQPRNVIITHRLHAALSDVGQSRAMTALGVRTGFTTGTAAVGFTGYLAAETLLGESTTTTMVDVYAFGGPILAVGSILFL